MSDPKRLLDEGSAFERSLLSAGRDEDPSRELEARILATLGAAPIAGAPDVPELPELAPTPPAPPSPFRFTAPRGLAMAAAVIGLGAVIAASTGKQSDAPAAPPAVVAAPAAAPVAPPAQPASVETVFTPDSLPSVPAPAAAAVPSARALAAASVRAPNAEAGTSIEREIELLDSVKSSLGAGNAAEAARALDAYDAEFPRGALRPEGTVLRIRTLLLQGDRASASKLGDDFLAKHPGSVHAKRIRALLAD